MHARPSLTTNNYSPRNHPFFHKKPQSKLTAAALMEYASVYNLKVVEQIITDGDPSIIFKPVKCKYHDGKIKSFSPLQYALGTCDTYLWKMMWHKVESDLTYRQLFLEAAKSSRPSFDLKPLFNEYEIYINSYTASIHNRISKTQLENNWITLGNQQFELLPLHMFMELCRNNDSYENAPTLLWSDQSSFDTENTPPPTSCKVFHAELNHQISLMPNCALEIPFTLSRGSNYLDCMASSQPRQRHLLEYDLNVLRMLTIRRMADITELLELNRMQESICTDKAVETKTSEETVTMRM